MRFVRNLSVILVMMTSVAAFAGGAWSRGQDRAEYCYPADDSGNAIPGSEPIPDYVCGGSSDFGRSTTGSYACFPTKADGTVLAGRESLPQADCERYGYKWAKDTEGHTQCFPLDKSGRVLPGLEAVAERNCY